MGFTIAYVIERKLYLNITNRCCNDCWFCIRKNKKGIGYDLWLDREPALEEILEAVGDITFYEEVVFCGYGEPLLRPEIVRDVAKELKSKTKVTIRINTNGLAEKILNRDILEELTGLIDIISISLNAHDAETYFKLCSPSLGIEAFNYVLEFAEKSKKFIPKVILTVVALPEVNIEACKKIARNVGAELRIRPYLTD